MNNTYVILGLWDWQLRMFRGNRPARWKQIVTLAGSEWAKLGSDIPDLKIDEETAAYGRTLCRFLGIPDSEIDSVINKINS